MGAPTVGKWLRAGIVGGHAYSLLDAREVHAKAGQQLTMQDALSAADPKPVAAAAAAASGGGELARPLRLLKVRNPWGAVEWKGAAATATATADATADATATATAHTTASCHCFMPLPMRIMCAVPVIR